MSNIQYSAYGSDLTLKNKKSRLKRVWHYIGWQSNLVLVNQQLILQVFIFCYDYSVYKSCKILPHAILKVYTNNIKACTITPVGSTLSVSKYSKTWIV